MLVTADCLDYLRTLPDDSIEACVTDPPYGLGAPPPIADVLRAWLAGEPYQPKGRGFMGHAWDAFVPGPEVWREVYRVLRPGSHLLAFFGTRTYDVGVLAIRLAGFEIRDEIAWLYGQGFPKALDVSKAIDKTRDDSEEVRVVCRAIRAEMEGAGLTSRKLAEVFSCHSRLIDHWAARDTDSQPSLPTPSQWAQLVSLMPGLSPLSSEVARLNRRKGEVGEAWLDRPITGSVEEWKDRTNYALTSRDGLRRDIPATPEAARWDGWATALKPAHEPIVVARKPFRGTVAQNVLAHGTGAYNVGACRIGIGEDRACGGATGLRRDAGEGYGGVWSAAEQGLSRPTGGRWPANVVLDEEAAEALDAQSGTLTSGSRREGVRNGLGYHGATGDGGPAISASSGGASRFFYCAKASAKDRGPENDHPTVKPVSLMRWLVRLVTPPGGTVLDPFAGSGTTGVAAMIEGFGFVGVEREPEYAEIARARIAGACAAEEAVVEDRACDSSEPSETE